MSTDRELLELAVKAAGYHLCTRNDGAVSMDMVNQWAPLADDGDALRLAVKLGLIIDVRYGDKTGAHLVCVNYWPTGYVGHHKTVSETSDDQLTATRRAIVRAAAEIGREMP